MNRYELITNTFINALNEGRIPWKKGWKSSHGLARNFITKKEYKGINRLILNNLGFDCPFWATFDQIKKLGGSVTKGSKGTIVLFYAECVSKNKDTNNDQDQVEYTNRYFVPKTYLVFNLAQTTGIDWTKDLEQLSQFKVSHSAEDVIKDFTTCPEIRHDDQRAFYSLLGDYVNMPKKLTFTSENEYYGTLFHELVHSTGHSSRLNRETLNSINHFGDHDYSKEELVAEIGASFLLSHCDLEDSHTLENSKAYIQSWISKLESDPKLILQASSLAEKAVGYILGPKAKDA